MAENLDVRTNDGTLFVADTGNRRIDVFDSSGEFVRAFGWGVVASGPGNDPRNEVEKIDVAATSGTFRLLFIQNSEQTISLIKQETNSVPFNAAAAEVQVALEGLAAISPGDVQVTGATGGPWIVEFTGDYADTDVHELEEGEKSELGGASAELEITTTQIGAKYEVCEAVDGDICRAGQRGIQSGQLNPTAVAVDPNTSDIYVFDGLDSSSHNEIPNTRVQKFTDEGEFLYMLGGGVNLGNGAGICTAASGDACGRGAKGSGTGEFNSSGSSIAVGPDGTLYVNDGGRAQKFDEAGGLIGQVGLPGVGPGELSVDSLGNLYATASGTEVRKYDSGGSLLETINTVSIGAIALDESDKLYVSNRASGRPGITRFDSGGSIEWVAYNTAVGFSGFPEASLAPYPAATAGDLYTISQGRVTLTSFPSPGPVVFPFLETNFADPIGNVRATLNAEVNPEGKATTFHFQYVEQAAFEAEGWSGTKVKETAESSSIGSDFLLHEAQAQIGCANPATEAAKCLTPSTEYRFRVVATNSDGTNEGPDATFTTKDPVEFGPLWTTGVGTEAATLHAELNPVGFATTGYFELVTEADFQATGFAGATKVPAGAPLDFGAGEAFVERSADAAGLVPGTAYRYRLVATNNCKPAEPSVICTSESDPASFATFSPPEPISGCANDAMRPGPAAFLADCRGYEMVSPVDKDGANVEAVKNPTGFLANNDQSAADGDGLTYSAYKSFGDAGGAPYSSQYISRRTPSGWVNEPISPPREGPTVHITEDLDFQFKGFTEDLCFGWWRQETREPLLASGALPGYTNLYRRDNCQPGQGDYRAETRSEVVVGADAEDFRPELQGFSTDGSKAFFAVAAKLTANAKNGKTQVYEVEGEAIKLVCLLPSGKAPNEDCSLGSGGQTLERERTLFNAVSDDGSRAFWTSEGKLYVRIDGTRTVPISEAISTGEAYFQGAAADGSKAVFTISGSLYEFDVDAEQVTLLAGGAQGVAGMSRDASKIYFVSTLDLDAGAEKGKPNLYLYEGGEVRYVATIPSDASLLLSPTAVKPFSRTSRVTPSGEQIVFMSKDPLTGYDNTDALTGKPDEEVFLYDAAASGGAGRLVCISCNPSGARPEGALLQRHPLIDYSVAAWIPTWTTQLYGPRVISEEGDRVFFNSSDALEARDGNHAQDVYQWEAPGTGDCSGSSSTYVVSALGCVSLVSSGTSSEASTYVDSSVSGEDVFFRTYSSLAPQDPELVDIYDARVGGGSLPAENPPIPCDSDDGGCQPARLAPQTPSPGSGVVGPGNPLPTKGSKKCRKGTHKVKRKGKVVCVKNKKKLRRGQGQGGGK